MPSVLIAIDCNHHTSNQCLFHARCLGGGNSPAPKLTTFLPPNGCQLHDLFFGRDNELQKYHGNFLLMDNQCSKVFVIKQWEGCKVMPKMHQNALCGRAPELGELMLMVSPRLPSRNGGPTSSGDGGKGRGILLRGIKEREETGDGNWGKGNCPPKSRSAE